MVNFERLKAYSAQVRQPIHIVSAGKPYCLDASTEIRAQELKADNWHEIIADATRFIVGDAGEQQLPGHIDNDMDAAGIPNE